MHARQISEIAVACLVLCAARPALAQATVNSGTSTVDLDALPDAGNTGQVSVGANVQVETTTGSALRGQNKSVDVSNQGTLTSHDTSVFAVHLQNGKQFTNAITGVVQGVGGAITGINAATTIYNLGNVLATTGPGIHLHAGGGVTNESGASIQGGSEGIFLINSSDTVINKGSIIATSGTGLRLEGGSVRVRNETSGTIAGTAFGITMVNGNEAVINAGAISGTDGTGIGVRFLRAARCRTLTEA